ncbi:MAG: HAMP domain-containing protein [Hyphomicrobiaceae bacterium]|nr:HAMP domain-containing protein [Hyphomicrobiaceae bacterium]
MALDTDRPSAPQLNTMTVRAKALSTTARSRVHEQWQATAGIRHSITRWTRRFGTKILPWARAQPIWRWCTASLRNRIIAANFIGLGILLSGLTLLTVQHTWLIDARTESLRTQARMIAVAIASNAKLRTDGLVIDPDQLTAKDGAFPQFHDDSLSRLAFDIAPEQVAPVLRRLIQNNDVRVRIVRRDGRILVDSNTSFGRSNAAPANGANGNDIESITDTRLRSLWTKFVAYFMRSSLQIYRELPSSAVLGYPEVQDSMKGNLGSMMLLNNEGEQIIGVAAPIQRLNTIPASVFLTTRPGDLESILWRERRPFFVLSLLALIATGLASWLLARTIGGPMHQLSRAAEHVSRNISNSRELPEMPDRRDEIGVMARNFSTMTAALYRRIEASDRFAQDVAHELKNPVAAARSTAESLGYAKTPEKRDELVRQIQGELKRLNRLISDVANASRLDAELALQETEPVDLSTITTNIAGVFRDIQNGQDGPPCKIELKIAPTTTRTDYRVDGNEGRIGQVITNLLDNAISFSPGEATVTLTLDHDGPDVVLTIDDEGPGIPPNKLEDVFKRFYSDRPQSDNKRGKNSGLGLSISREIIEAHGGVIRAQNIKAIPGQEIGVHDVPELAERRIEGVAGVRFEIRLPRLTVQSR